MAAVNYALTGFMILTIFLLLSIMILGAMSATAAEKRDYDTAHKYSTWASIVAGVCTAILIFCTVWYIITSRACIAKDIYETFGMPSRKTCLADGSCIPPL